MKKIVVLFLVAFNYVCGHMINLSSDNSNESLEKSAYIILKSLPSNNDINFQTIDSDDLYYVT